MISFLLTCLYHRRFKNKSETYLIKQIDHAQKSIDEIIRLIQIRTADYLVMSGGVATDICRCISSTGGKLHRAELRLMIAQEYLAKMHPPTTK